MKEGFGGRTEMTHITNKPKGLKGSPRVGVKLRMSNFKRLKDTHDKLVKRKKLCEDQRRA